MNAPAAPPAAPVPGAWEMYRAMVGVGLVCGLLIVSAYVGTGPIIARNRAAMLQHAIFQVLPAAHATRTFRLAGDDRLEPVAEAAGADRVVYAAYDPQGQLVGVAVEASGLGYQDTIRVLYGYVPGASAIVGIHVLESRDTPGLGDRIESDPAFLQNFAHLDVALAAGGEQLAHPIKAVKHGTKSEPWQVDTITGATISSSAVANIIGASAAFWVPRIHRNLDILEQHR
ncbi:MAG: FMN-binding protein [Candidatus Binatia bacterium]